MAQKGQFHSQRVWLLAVVISSNGFTGGAYGEVASDDLPEYRQEVWHTDRGLPNNMIQALLQTEDGYLWIGTANGLVRFDGIQFKAYQRLHFPEMGSDDCRLLAQATDGTLWIATRDGLLRFSQGEFQRLTADDGLPASEVRALRASRYGEMWIGTAHGLCCWRGGKLCNFSSALGRDPAEVVSIGEDLQSDIWVQTSEEMLRFGRKGDVFLAERLGNEWLQRGLVKLDQPSEGEWAFSSPRSPAGTLHHFQAGRWETYSAPGPVERAGYPQFLVRDRTGCFWSSAGTFGLDRLRDGHFERLTTDNGLSDSWVISFCADREGNLWIGTNNGLNCWRPRGFRVFSKKDGLAHDNAWTLCEAHDGSLWIGTDGGVSHLKNRTFTNYTVRSGLVWNSVRALAEDLKGTIWIGTGHGLSLFDGSGFKNVTLPGEPSGGKIRAVHLGRDGSIWVGTEQCLHRYQSGQWTSWARSAGLPNGDVRAIYEARNGALWIGTYGGGATLFDPLTAAHSAGSSAADGTPRVVRSQSALPAKRPAFQIFTTTNGLGSDFVWCFHEDTDGALWIGTEHGLARFHDGSLRNFTVADGLEENLVNYILEDDGGCLWLSGESGIYRMRRQELNDVAAGRRRRVTVAAFGEADGMLSAETNGQKSEPAGCKTRDGVLWFPTTKGVVRIDPNTDVPDGAPPQVVLQQIRADGKVVFEDGASVDPDRPRAQFPEVRLDVPKHRRIISEDFSREEAPLRSGPQQADISLHPGSVHVLELHYTANSFVAPANVRFKYRLDGYDEDWTDAATRRVAYYTNLRPGHYCFRVIAASPHGVWNETGAVAAIYLAPRFYQTWLFYAACTLGLFTLIGAMHHLRVSLITRFQSLERENALARERERLARDLHDEIGSRLTQLAMLSGTRSVAGVSPLTSGSSNPRFAALAREAIRCLDEVVWLVRPGKNTLDDLASYLGDFAHEYLQGTGVALELDLPDPAPDSHLRTEVRHHLLLVAKEALNNIVKHSGATRVRVRLTSDGRYIGLEIEDNGGGFTTTGLSVGGDGLTNIRQRVDQIGGHLRVTSSPQQGTSIRVRVPRG